MDIPLTNKKEIKVNESVKKFFKIDSNKSISELKMITGLSPRTLGRLRNIKINLSEKSINHLLQGKFSVPFADNYIHKNKNKEKIKTIDSMTGMIATKEYLFAYEEFFKQIRVSRSNHFKNTDRELILKHIDNIRAYADSDTNGFKHINERRTMKNGSS